MAEVGRNPPAEVDQPALEPGSGAISLSTIGRNLLQTRHFLDEANGRLSPAVIITLCAYAQQG